MHTHKKRGGERETMTQTSFTILLKNDPTSCLYPATLQLNVQPMCWQTLSVLGPSLPIKPSDISNFPAIKLITAHSRACGGSKPHLSYIPSTRTGSENTWPNPQRNCKHPLFRMQSSSRIGLSWSSKAGHNKSSRHPNIGWCKSTRSFFKL